MCFEKVELSLYTSMNEYNKHGDKFNEVIINDIDSVVTKQMTEFTNILERAKLTGIDKLILKYSEVSSNCKLLLSDLNDTDKINKLKSSIEELKIIEENIRKNLFNILKQLGIDGIIQK